MTQAFFTLREPRTDDSWDHEPSGSWMGAGNVLYRAILAKDCQLNMYPKPHSHMTMSDTAGFTLDSRKRTTLGQPSSRQ